MRLKTDGLTINYEYARTSAAPPMPGAAVAPVVFSHPLAATLAMWDPQVEALAGRYDTLRYDTRGHGGSSIPPAPYSVDTLVDDVVVLLDTLGIERVHFVGLSLGGIVGQVFALRHADRLGALVLADTSPRTPEEAHALWDERIALALAEGMEPLVDPTIGRWFTPPFAASGSRVVERVREMIRNTDPVGYAGCAAAVKHHDVAARLGEIRVRTLIIAGADDSGMPAETVREMQSAIPGSEAVVIQAAAHLSNLEQPRVFNDALLEFLSRVDGRALGGGG